MSEPNTPKSLPPPAHNLVVLSADLLAVAAKNLLEQLAAANWQPMQQLKGALETYETVRLGQVLKEPAPLPTCEGCKHREQCNGVPALERDCYQPLTQRNS